MEDFNRKEMSFRLGNLRVEKGISQDDVAEALDVSRETYTQIEGGKRKLKDHEIVLLANLFGVTTDFILRGVESGNVSISDATGLGNSSIAYLREVNESRNIPFERQIEGGRKYERINQALNIILSRNGDSFLEDLANYLLADTTQAFPVEDGTLHAEIPVDSVGVWVGNDVVSLSVKAIRLGMLRELESDLEELRSLSTKPDDQIKKRVRGNQQ